MVCLIQSARAAHPWTQSNTGECGHTDVEHTDVEQCSMQSSYRLWDWALHFSDPWDTRSSLSRLVTLILNPVLPAQPELFLIGFNILNMNTQHEELIAVKQPK